MANDNIYQMVTDRIIAEMEKGIIPWQKPWNGGECCISKEELVAEMGAAMLVSTAGIECEKAFKNSVGYLQGWLKALSNDNKLIVLAAGKAEAAVKYILNGKQDND